MKATSSTWLIPARQRVLRIWRGTGDGMVLDELDLLRDRGMRILVLIGWASTAAMAILGWLAGNVVTIAVVALSAATTVLPTLLVLRKRHDRVARLMTGSMVVIHPALALYLLQGEGWSAYASMYSFVALASLIVLCDWRPIAIATILTVVHHVAASARQGGGNVRTGKS